MKQTRWELSGTGTIPGTYPVRRSDDALNYDCNTFDGREAFGENFGISYKDIQNAGLFAPVVKCTVDYKLPLRHGDWATVETNYIDEVASKLHFTYKIFNSEDKLAATGETIQVFTDQKSGELFLSNPPFLEEWKKKHNLL